MFHFTFLTLHAFPTTRVECIVKLEELEHQEDSSNCVLNFEITIIHYFFFKSVIGGGGKKFINYMFHYLAFPCLSKHIIEAGN